MSHLRRVSECLGLLLILLVICAIVGNIVIGAMRVNALNAAQVQTARYVQTITASLRTDDLSEPKVGDAYHEFARRLQPLLNLETFLRVKIYNRLGTVIWSDEPRLVGQQETAPDGNLALAFTGNLAAQYLREPKAESGYTRAFREVVELYVPLRGTGPGIAVVGVAEVYQDLGPLMASVRRIQQKAWLALVISFVVLLGLLQWLLWRDAWRTARQVQSVHQRHREILLALAASTEDGDPAAGHARRVAALAGLLADLLVLRPAERCTLDTAALLHHFAWPEGPSDTGRFRPPAPWALPEEVGVLIRTARSCLQAGACAGDKQPDRLGRVPIPTGARILAVADRYDTVRGQETAGHGSGEESHEATLAVLRADGRLDQNLVELLARHRARITPLYRSGHNGALDLAVLTGESNTEPGTAWPRPWPGINVGIAMAGLGAVLGALIYPGVLALEASLPGLFLLMGALAAVGALVGSLIARAWLAATHDALTGLPNRRMLMTELARQTERSRRRQQPLGLVLVDVDHFKDINDRYGHLNGDKVLVTVADVLRSELPPGAMACRIGGDEFGVILPGMQSDLAAAWVARFRQKTWEETGRFLASLGEQGARVSAGFAAHVCGETLNQFLVRADEAMYQEKRHHQMPKPDTGRAGARLVATPAPTAF